MKLKNFEAEGWKRFSTSYPYILILLRTAANYSVRQRYIIAFRSNISGAPRRQPARAMNSHDRRPGPSPSLGSSVAQAGRAVKQGFELGTGTALQIARLSWFSRPCRSGPSGKKSGRPGTRGWQNEMKGRQCYLFGNLLVKFQSSWILMLVQCFILRKFMLYWIFAWHKLLRYNSVVILDACKVMSCLLEIFSISAIYLSSLWY